MTRESRRELSRRALLFSGGAAAIGAIGWATGHDAGSGPGSGKSPERRAGVPRPREDGDVDHPGAEWVPAAEANWRPADRPRANPVDRVIIHMPQATYPITLKVFRDPRHRATAHYVVRSADGHVAQLVRERDVAYHAGNRWYNARSIGIEHEGWVDRPEYLTETMYRASARLTAGICERYDIPKDREHIIGHIEVPGSDHTCPGPHWDWERYIALVRRIGDHES